jgi:hypothetical protein
MRVDTDAATGGVAVMAGAATMAGVNMRAAGRNGEAITALASVRGAPKAAVPPPPAMSPCLKMGNAAEHDCFGLMRRMFRLGKGRGFNHRRARLGKNR